MKISSFKEIPKFTANPPYYINVGWKYLSTNLEMFKKDYSLDMDPDFQRGHVWSESQQIKYVEFILRGGESGREILFNCTFWNSEKKDSDRMELVDGKQRIHAVLRFLNNEIPAFGTLYKDYEDDLNIMVQNFTFRVNNLESRKEVLQWYVDINDGGTPHPEEEIKKVREMIKNESKADK